MNQIPLPEGNVVKRPLRFFWLTDYSGSMTGRKIASLNQGIREALPEVRNALDAHPEIALQMSAIKFSNDASWHVGPDPVALDQFVWPELGTSGLTSTAQAIQMLCDELDMEKMPRRTCPPVCILMSDGFCTDSAEDYDAAIDRLNSLPWGKKAVRLAIAIGEESEYDEDELLKFINQENVGVINAHNPAELTHYIKWASTAASIGASVGKSLGSAADATSNVHLPSPPPPTKIDNSNDVF